MVESMRGSGKAVDPSGRSLRRPHHGLQRVWALDPGSWRAIPPKQVGLQTRVRGQQDGRFPPTGSLLFEATESAADGHAQRVARTPRSAPPPVHLWANGSTLGFHTGGLPLHEPTPSGAAVRDALIVGASRQNHGCWTWTHERSARVCTNTTRWNKKQERVLGSSAWLPVGAPEAHGYRVGRQRRTAGAGAPRCSTVMAGQKTTSRVGSEALRCHASPGRQP